MSHVPHELAEEFPDSTDILHELKLANGRFNTLAERYHTVNREIHRLETGVEPGSEFREIELRKERLHLKDEISALIAEQSQ